MSIPHTEAKNAIKQALCAAVLVRPLDPGMTRDEVREAVLHLQVGPGALDEVLSEEWDRHRKDKSGRALAGGLDWDTFLYGSTPVPEALVPMAALNKLADAFVGLDREKGERPPKSLAMITAAIDGVRPEEIQRAIGVAVSVDKLRTAGDGFVSTVRLQMKYREAPSGGVPHPWQAPLEQLVPILKVILAMRAGQDIPETPPLERFAGWLKNKGWNEFASWWALTTEELESFSDSRQPTSICVLTGALLEAALVAMAEPAVAAGEWRQKFLNSPPETWKLYDLIDQAETAKTFTKDQAVEARTLAGIRNRIHAGRFSAGGKPPFAPPHTNVHEARMAKLHLDHLLDVILRWPPVCGGE